MLNKRPSALLATLLSLGVMSLTTAPAVMADTTINDALNASIREDDKERDASRKPAETLAFFGVDSSSSVLELMPGGGWYTKVLGTYLKDSGQLYVSIGVNKNRLELEDNNLEHVKIVGESIKLAPTESPAVFNTNEDAIDFGVSDLDAVLTFRNLHNLSVQARNAINNAAFQALKPGGVYGVIDHTRRHMEPVTDETWRRVDPVQIIKETLAAGFVFDDYSDLHARPADGLIFDTTDDSLNRDSDRFTLKFRKPK